MTKLAKKLTLSSLAQIEHAILVKQTEIKNYVRIAAKYPLSSLTRTAHVNKLNAELSDLQTRLVELKISKKI